MLFDVIISDCVLLSIWLQRVSLFPKLFFRRWELGPSDHSVCGRKGGWQKLKEAKQRRIREEAVLKGTASLFSFFAPNESNEDIQTTISRRKSAASNEMDVTCLMCLRHMNLQLFHLSHLKMRQYPSLKTQASGASLQRTSFNTGLRRGHKNSRTWIPTLQLQNVTTPIRVVV